MTQQAAYVNPVNSAISVVDLDGKNLTTGTGEVFRWPKDGSQVVFNRATIPAPDPVGIDIYERRAGTQAQPAYHVAIASTYSLEGGPARDANAYVQERKNYDKISINDLRNVKEGELRSQLSFVFFTNCENSLDTNWVVMIEETDDSWYSTIDTELTARLGLNIDPVWQQNVPVRALRKANRNMETIDLNVNQWRQVVEDIRKHRQQAVEASICVQNTIEQHYNANNWDALAAIDVTAAQWNWPPVFVPT